MNDTQAATVPALVIRRTFNAPRERVFAAWTDPKLVRDWFGPPGTRVNDVTFEARHGGRFRIAMQSSDGEDFIVGGVITEYTQPERLAYTFRWQEDDPQNEYDTYIRVEFIDRGAKTDLVFTQEGFAGEASRERHEQGWTATFTQLAGLVAGAPRVTITGLDFSGYMVKDAPRAIEFYRDVFGLEPTLLYPDDRGAEYDLPDGATFGLWGGGGKVMPFQPGNGILFAVDDLATAVATIEARGIVVNYRAETPHCRLAMMNDTEGNIITLHQRKVK